MMPQYWFEGALQLSEDWEESGYESVNSWIRAIRRYGNSRATKRSYFKFLGYLCRYSGLNPDQLLALGKEEAEDVVQRFCHTYAAKGQLRTAHIFTGYARSFYKHNGVSPLNLEDYRWRASRRPERVPTKQEVYQMASAAVSLRDRALILCAFQSGLRNSTIRALRYGDLKEQIEAGRVPIVIHITPALKRRIPRAAKEDVEYHTFFGSEACDALRLYLDNRKRAQGTMEDDEPLFSQEGGYDNRKDKFRHLHETVLQRLVKKAGRRAGMSHWQHVKFHSLRKTFRSVLDAGYRERGQMAKDDKEFLMGHTLPSQKAPYHNANVDTLARRYMRLNWAASPSITREQARTEFIKMMMGQVGDSEMSSLAAQLGMTPQQVRALIRRVRGEEGIEKRETETLLEHEREQRTAPNGGYHNNHYKYKILTESELCEHLEEGWDLVKEMSNGKLVVRKEN